MLSHHLCETILPGRKIFLHLVKPNSTLKALKLMVACIRSIFLVNRHRWRDILKTNDFFKSEMLYVYIICTNIKFLQYVLYGVLYIFYVRCIF